MSKLAIILLFSTMLQAMDFSSDPRELHYQQQLFMALQASMRMEQERIQKQAQQLDKEESETASSAQIEADALLAKQLQQAEKKAKDLPSNKSHKQPNGRIRHIKKSNPLPKIRYTSDTLVPRKRFFQYIMGMSEEKVIHLWQHDKSAYNALMKNAIVAYGQADGTVGFKLRRKDGKFFNAGSFQELSIGQLREWQRSMEKPGGGTFNVVVGYNTNADSWFHQYVEVGVLQADPRNRDAVFQVASNFSALEPVSNVDYPEGGVTKYIYDMTQGPIASLSAAPGVILRMYTPFFNPQKHPASWRQTQDHQVNLLDQVPQLPIVNGYVDFTGDNADYLSYTITEQDKLALKVGFHGNIQVVSGYLKDKNTVVKQTDPNQLVNQVFTAAIDFGYLNSHLKHERAAIEKACILLDTAYEGTIKAVAYKGKKKLFLTLIGGGVFDNNLLWIAKAIEKNIEFIKDAGLDVTLILYNHHEFGDFHKRLYQMTAVTGGIYREYKDDGMYELT